MLRDDVQPISVDDHVVEPPHVFVDHIDPNFRDRAPPAAGPVDGDQFGGDLTGWRQAGRREDDRGHRQGSGGDRADHRTPPRRSRSASTESGPAAALCRDGVRYPGDPQ